MLIHRTDTIYSFLFIFYYVENWYNNGNEWFYRYKWQKVHLFYLTNGQSRIAGKHTCQLMMKSMVEFVKRRQDFSFGTFDAETTSPKDYVEALRDHVGNTYSGESLRFFNNCFPYFFFLFLPISSVAFLPCRNIFLSSVDYLQCCIFILQFVDPCVCIFTTFYPTVIIIPKLQGSLRLTKDRHVLFSQSARCLLSNPVTPFNFRVLGLSWEKEIWTRCLSWTFATSALEFVSGFSVGWYLRQVVRKFVCWKVIVFFYSSSIRSCSWKSSLDLKMW